MTTGIAKWPDHHQGHFIPPDGLGEEALGTPRQGTGTHGLKRQEEDYDGEAHT